MKSKTSQEEIPVEKKYRKLSKIELLELLIDLMEENTRLKGAVSELESQREILLNQVRLVAPQSRDEVLSNSGAEKQAGDENG